MLKALLGRFKDVQVKSISAFLAGAVLIFFIFLWRLSSMTRGLGPAEASSRLSSQSVHSIYADPLNAPHQLIQYLLRQIGQGGTFNLRLASVIAAVLFGFCFYKLAVNWFGKPIGPFGSLIFISLPLFVVASRQASSEIMFFSPVLIMWLYTWLIKKDSRKNLAWLTLLIAAGLLLYTPGMIWWIAAAFGLCRKRILSAVAGVPALISAAGLTLFTASVAPLVISSVHKPQLIKQLLLAPMHWSAPLQVVKNIGWMILSLLVRTPFSNPLAIGRLPVLNVLLIALLIFGVYAMQGVARTKAALLGLSVMFAVVAAGINNNLAYLALSLPAIGLFISAGLRYLYVEWRTIFPKNPVPKTFALLLIAAVAFSQLYYGLRYSLVAWPHSSATRTAYVIK